MKRFRSCVSSRAGSHVRELTSMILQAAPDLKRAALLRRHLIFLSNLLVRLFDFALAPCQLVWQEPKFEGLARPFITSFTSPSPLRRRRRRRGDGEVVWRTGFLASQTDSPAGQAGRGQVVVAEHKSNSRTRNAHEITSRFCLPSPYPLPEGEGTMEEAIL